VLLTAVLTSYLNFITVGFQTDVSEDELLVRLIAAGSIVSVCGLLAITIFLAANRRALVTTSASVKEIRAVKVTCPRCATKTDAAAGVGGARSRCGGCGLIFVIELAEPRCVKCEYNLLDLKSDRCPECGTPVAESLQVGV
jgi:Zn finger protein HypA/HybF involved in hydrogenase expression